MVVHVCSVCGYVYDDEQEGTAFELMNDNYVCPLCGASKDKFRVED